MDKVFFNKSSADSLGWDPTWFGATQHDEDLVKAIASWQKKNGLKADGMCGPVTFRRIWTQRQSSSAPQTSSTVMTKSNNSIIHNGKKIPIEWDKVVLWSDKDGLTCKQGTYNPGPTSVERKPAFFVNHWDACLTTKSMAEVLERRGISIHFGIDNDGTIYQLLDTQHIAWHAGDRKWNQASIGVEISNAFYSKYQDWYAKNGFGKRPVVPTRSVKCHGAGLEEHLGFYDVQIEALKALWLAVHRGIGINLECPLDSSGKLVETVDSRCEKSEFNGFINHYNLTKRKIDCAGLDLKKLLSQIKA